MLNWSIKNLKSPSNPIMKKKLSNFVRSAYCAARGIPTLGLWGATKFLLASHFNATFKIKPKSDQVPLMIRGNTSDVETFFSIIIRRSYPAPERPVKTIIDAGANVGYAAAFFANAYPNAEVFALEPELSNFSLLTKNTVGRQNITPINCALWRETRQIFLQDPSAEPWAFQFGESPMDRDSVQAYSVPDFMEKYNIEKIDILKIDIEGAEKYVFSGETEWLRKVNTIYIEIHDRLAEGAGSTVFRTMVDYAYEFDVMFEYTVFDNISAIKPIE